MSVAVPAIDRRRLDELSVRERRMFSARHPRSLALFDQAKRVLLNGVPMSWMSHWPGGYPIFLAEAKGASLTDVDGNCYVDFCLGDTGALAGHAPDATAEAVRSQFARGATAMLPTETAAWVATELGRRFGLPVWQFSLTATDANRWVLRLARALTGRPKVLVFNGCYHGTVDETVVVLDRKGRAMSRHGNVGPAVDPALTSDVIEFNDIEALDRALQPRNIACVITEPALTNAAGIVLPEPGYHDALRAITASTGTYLILDETQTFPNGPGGYTREHGLKPDFLTIGKAIAGGVPLGAYGMRREVADGIIEAGLDMGDTGAVGGTLAGNALSLAAARATLADVLTDEAHTRMNALGARFAEGVRSVILAHGLPWHVVRLGARVEYRFSPQPPRTGGESLQTADKTLDSYLHLYMLNRGILMTPFHNMALMSPATRERDVDRHAEIFAGAADELLAKPRRKATPSPDRGHE